MVHGIIHQFVDHLLIDDVVFERQSHHAVTKNRHVIVGVVVDAVRHLVFRDVAYGICSFFFITL